MDADSAAKELTRSNTIHPPATLLPPDEKTRHAVADFRVYFATEDATKDDAASLLEQNKVARLNAAEFTSPDKDEIAVSNPWKQGAIFHEKRAKPMISDFLGECRFD